MIYSKKLEDYIRKNKNIVRKINYNSIKINNIYYSYKLNTIFKCIDIIETENEKYYTIKYDKKIHILSFDKTDKIYVIYKNNKRKIDNIINSDKYYYGFEILYWFIVNKINLNSKKYKGFKSYIEYYSNNTHNCQIHSNDKYKIKAELNDKDFYYKIEILKKKK